jgi:hypothetical protein
MRCKNKWNVVLHKEIGDVVIVSFTTKKQAEDYLLTRKELTHHLIGNQDVYTVEYGK